jgi:hypothetical protein
MERQTKLLQFRAPESLSEAIDAAAEQNCQPKSELPVEDAQARARDLAVNRRWNGALTQLRLRLTATRWHLSAGLAGGRSSPAHYIWHFTSFSFVICPSVWPLDQSSVMAARTAALS